jgi:hypothetical protein
VSKAKCFPVSRQNIRKHTNIGKALEQRGARVIYQVRKITHRAITTNKRDEVIVTMHASTKLYKNYNSKSIKKGKDTRAHQSSRLLPKLEI